MKFNNTQSMTQSNKDVIFFFLYQIMTSTTV